MINYFLLAYVKVSTLVIVHVVAWNSLVDFTPGRVEIEVVAYARTAGKINAFSNASVVVLCRLDHLGGHVDGAHRQVLRWTYRVVAVFWRRIAWTGGNFDEDVATLQPFYIGSCWWQVSEGDQQKRYRWCECYHFGTMKAPISLDDWRKYYARSILGIDLIICFTKSSIMTLIVIYRYIYIYIYIYIYCQPYANRCANIRCGFTSAINSVTKIDKSNPSSCY